MLGWGTNLHWGALPANGRLRIRSTIGDTGLLLLADGYR